MLQIIEVKPETYKIPAIDNRPRKGYAMYQAVCDRQGTPSMAQLTTISGEVKQVSFTAMGWMVL